MKKEIEMEEKLDGNLTKSIKLCLGITKNIMNYEPLVPSSERKLHLNFLVSHLCEGTDNNY